MSGSKNLAIKLISIILFVLIFAVSASADQICLPSDTVGEMVVDLEKCELLKERYNILEQGNAELEKQIELLEKVNDLQKEQLQVLKETNQQYRDLVEVQGKMYQEAIKASKPSFFKEAFKAAGNMGIGVLLLLLLTL